jgi:acyl-CoA thioesterase FadM
MAAPRTTLAIRVRSYEIRPDGRAGAVSFLNWFQEAAFANSIELGYSPARYQALGISWVMRENDLQLIERPRFNETIHITTWLADIQRVKAFRQYEARRSDGVLLARCNTQWVMLNLHTLRPTRVPEQMLRVFDPAQDYILAPREWPEAPGEGFRSAYRVPFFEEDELGTSTTRTT